MLDSRPVTLSVSDIHKSFGSLDVLKGITIQAQQGDVISILGASGSGKSTLSATLAGREDYEVTGGSVEYKGKDLLELRFS